MFPPKRRLANYSTEQVCDLAKAWLENIRSNPTYELDEISLQVAYFSFFAPRELKWDFIHMSTATAQTDEELAALAAGPIQQVLVELGRDAFPIVEELSRADSAFKKATQGVNGSESLDKEVLSLLQGLRSKPELKLRESAIRSAHMKRVQSEEAILEILKELKRKRAESKANEYE